MPKVFLAALTTSALVALPAFAVEKKDVLITYADIAEAKYSDSLTAAQSLQLAVGHLVAAPSAEALIAARLAYLAARTPYMQTEAYRFGNPIVDAWEGRINAWPLDEGFIDYVDAAYGGPTDENEYAALNIIATPKFILSGTEIDASLITPALLGDTLNEADGVTANVATGYHAIEFLLWGQDLNGTGPGAGARAWSDYATGDACTNANCDRRAQYLQAATTLLVDDLAWMAGQWGTSGAARAAVLADPDAGIGMMLTGLGSLSYGELAGQRMKLGVLLNDPEEEHDCFSDNTQNSHYMDGIGIQGTYLGTYTRLDGTVVSGASLSGLVAEKDGAVDTQLRGELAASVAALKAVVTATEGGMAYDMMLAQGNEAGAALLLTAVDKLVAQTRSIERAVAVLDLKTVTLEGSDSLDDPNAVFQ